MNMKTMRRAILSFMMVAALAACNLPVTPTPLVEPTTTPAPTAEPQAAPEPLGAACVVGTWQITNLADYLSEALPQMVEGASLTPGEVSGSLTVRPRIEVSTRFGRSLPFPSTLP